MGVLVATGAAIGALGAIVDGHGVATAASVILVCSGLVLALRAARAGAPGRVGEVSRDLVRVGLVIAVGATGQIMHGLLLPDVGAAHGALAIGVGLAGGILGTIGLEDQPEEGAVVVAALRWAGAVLALGAVLIAVSVGLGASHSAPEALSLLIVSIAGFMLARVPRSTPFATWARL
jgi:hypothetical protein